MPVARRASAEICGGCKLATGEKIILRILDSMLIAQRDNVVVAKFPAPPPEFRRRQQMKCVLTAGLLAALRLPFPWVHAGLELPSDLVGSVTCLRQVHVGIGAERKTDCGFLP